VVFKSLVPIDSARPALLKTNEKLVKNSNTFLQKVTSHHFDKQLWARGVKNRKKVEQSFAECIVQHLLYYLNVTCF
jgi:hypothetical protein